MIRLLLIGVLAVLLVAAMLPGGLTSRIGFAPRQECFTAREATAIIVRKVTADDDKERWVVTVAFVPADWQRTYASPQEAPRTRHMGFWSAEGKLGTMAPIIAYTTNTE